MSQNFSKSFFYESKASQFAEYLKSQGAEDIEIWGGRDAFGQPSYSVRWNLWK